MYPINNVENCSKEVKYLLQKSHILTKELMEKHKKDTKLFDNFAKHCNLNINEKVFVKKPDDKFKHIYDGPFIV